jgi:hypothetical protein
MKKIFLTTLFVSVATFFTSAQIAGDYDGFLTGSGGQITNQPTKVTLSVNDENYTLTVPVGTYGEAVFSSTISVVNDNNATLSAVSTSLLGIVPANLVTGKVEEGILSFVFTVDASAFGGGNLTFTFTNGVKSSGGTAIIDVEAKQVVIYPTVVSKGEKITVSGIEAGKYAIYTLTGNSVKSGIVENGTINTTGLPSNIYILNAAGKTGKFIVK